MNISRITTLNMSYNSGDIGACFAEGSGLAGHNADEKLGYRHAVRRVKRKELHLVAPWFYRAVGHLERELEMTFVVALVERYTDSTLGKSHDPYLDLTVAGSTSDNDRVVVVRGNKSRRPYAMYSGKTCAPYMVGRSTHAQLCSVDHTESIDMRSLRAHRMGCITELTSAGLRVRFGTTYIVLFHMRPTYCATQSVPRSPPPLGS